jgi:hypothetical protein
VASMPSFLERQFSDLLILPVGQPVHIDRFQLGIDESGRIDCSSVTSRLYCTDGTTFSSPGADTSTRSAADR